MRTLSEIIDATRNGQKPDYDELRYAVCAMDALMTFDHMALSRLAEAEAKAEERGVKAPLLGAMYQFKERFDRVKRALAKSPKEWVGWNNDPDNPEFVARRRANIALYGKITAKVSKENI